MDVLIRVTVNVILNVTELFLAKEYDCYDCSINTRRTLNPNTLFTLFRFEAVYRQTT